MTSSSAFRQDKNDKAAKDKDGSETQDKEKQASLADRQAPRIPEITAKKAEALKGKSGLQHLRITAAPKAPDEDMDGNINMKITAARAEPPLSSADDNHEAEDEEPVLMLTPENALPPVQRPLWHNILSYGAAVFSAMWLVYGLSYALTSYGLAGLAAMPPPELGGLMAGILAPVALLWMVLGYWQRTADIQRYAGALRAELQSIIFPSEERAQRVSKDIERLCRQAAELSTSSKAVIKAIGRARQGLRTEVRDFVGLSKKTEFHIERLTDSLHEKAQKLVVLTEEIEQRTGAIDEKTQAGAEAWDQATVVVLERAAEMEGAMGRGADKIIEAAGQAGDKAKAVEKYLNNSFISLNKSVDDVAARLQGLSGEFDSHIQGLSKAADHVSEETTRLAETIESQIGSLEDVAHRTLESMGKSSESINQHRDALDDSADSIARQADKIADTINVSIGNLNDSADYMSSRTDELEDRIAAQADKLRDTVGSIAAEAGQIEEAGVSAANKLSEAMTAALSGAESISAAVRRSLESLEVTTRSAKEQAESLIDSTDSHITRLNEAGEGNVAHIRAIVDLLEQSREQIEQASSLADAQVTKLSGAVEDQSERIHVSTASMVERLKAVQESLEEPLKAMGTAVREADYRHLQIEETLSKRVADLHEASGKAREGADHIRSILRGQAQEISTLAGQITGHARAINQQMDERADTLDERVKESLAGVEKVRDALEAQASRLKGLSDEAIDDVDRLNDRMTERCDEIGVQTAQALKTLESLDGSFDDCVIRLETRSEKATGAIETVMAALTQTADAFEPVFDSAMDKVEQTRDAFADLHGNFEKTSSSNLERLQHIGVLFDERLQALNDGSDKAAAILKSSSDHMQERVEDIERASLSASEKMEEIESAMRDQSSDIHLITDQALLKIENVQKAVYEQFHELSESVGQAIVQIAEVGEELSKSAGHVDDVAAHAVEKFTMAGGHAREECESLSIAAAKTVTLTEELVKQVGTSSNDLLQASRESLMALKKTGDGFAMRAKEIEGQMSASLVTARDYGDELKKQAAFVADSAGSATETIGKALTTLSGRVDDIGMAAGSAVKMIEQSREGLAEESERILSVSSAAVKAANDTLTSFDRQSSTLSKAVQEAAHHTEKVRREEWRTQRNAFMGAAKFIVESLHSLSVDLTRLNDGEVSEKTWKAFQKGDVGAFTRRLVQLGEQWPVDKVRDKFANDSEFRTYVQRFIRQYEELHEQAVANDHGDLLGATFMSSDIGRLYTRLCQAAGREPVSGRDDKKAA